MKTFFSRHTRILRILLPSIIIVIWLAVAGIGGPYFGKISEVSSNDLATFLPKSAESTEVNGLLEKFRNQESIPAIIVIGGEGKELSADTMAKLTKVSAQLPEVSSVEAGKIMPIQSDDKQAAIMVIPLEADADFETVFPAVREKLNAADLGASYQITGPASFANDLRNAFAGIDGTLLIVALSVVFIILLIVYRSPVLPFIVLFTSISALSAAIFVVYYLAKINIVQLNGQVQGILFILVIGAATDYSLLYIARYREELVAQRSKWKATQVALKSSFEPILAAGGTVTVGLLCLLFSDLGSNKALGPVGGIGIILSITAALTLLPALLLAFGRNAFWPLRPKYKPALKASDYKNTHPMWAKIGAFVQLHPRRIWVATTMLLLVACVGVFQLKAEGVPQGDFILGKSEARDGQKILAAHFPSGSGAPAYVVTSVDKKDEVVRAIEATSGADAVSISAEGTEADSVPVGAAAEELKQKIPPALYPFKDATPKVVDEKILLQVTLSDAADSLEARDTIVSLRANVEKIDSNALIGGTTAVQYDTNQAALRDEKVIIPIILVAITIILMLLLRAVVAPIVLLLTTVLSFGATLGISALLFNHVWQFPGADPSVVIFGFVFLVALGIDYNIFLMTRVREETLLHGVREGTIKGLVVTGGVITSAGVVLAATFAALNVIPILFLAQLSFIVAFGVLLDTIIVRSLLVPSLTLEVRRFMWWPSRLGKVRAKD